jgi:TRAP-type mannitol/chloroaromatic compound transport system permease small subunit
MNTVTSVASFVLPVWVVWVLFIGIFAAFWVISTMLKHHWDDQDFAKEKIQQMKKFYFQVSYILLGALFLLAIIYTLNA